MNLDFRPSDHVTRTPRDLERHFGADQVEAQEHEAPVATGGNGGGECWRPAGYGTRARPMDRAGFDWVAWIDRNWGDVTPMPRHPAQVAITRLRDGVHRLLTKIRRACRPRANPRSRRR